MKSGLSNDLDVLCSLFYRLKRESEKDGRVRARIHCCLHQKPSEQRRLLNLLRNISEMRMSTSKYEPFPSVMPSSIISSLPHLI
jgi:hypothetical protein